MKTRHNYYATRKHTAQNIIIDNNGLPLIQPKVRLVGLQIQNTPSKGQRGRKAKNDGQTKSKLIKVHIPKTKLKRPGTPKSRGRPNLKRRIHVQSTSDESTANESPPKVNPPKIHKSVQTVKSDNRTNQTANKSTSHAFYYRHNDMVLYAIDLNKNCYAVDVFPNPFDAKVSTIDEYLTKSMDNAELLCRQISLGMCNTKKRAEIHECNNVSPMILERIIEMQIFEMTIQKYHLREERLRYLNNEIVMARKENQLLNCIRFLDELHILFRSWITKLILKKQPRIVCTLVDLASEQIDGFAPQWNMIKNIVAKTLADIMRIFDFNGSDKDFKNWFLMEIELFTELTAHLSEREKFELIVDPVKKIDLPTAQPYLQM